MATTDFSFPYHEPSIVTVLIFTSFLLILNISNYILDRLIYCGLLGQILIGVWFGTPGAGWLSIEIEGAVQMMGYLGLILLVYEGGLSTSIKKLRANLLLSSAVALTGICAPIALSFVLQTLLNISPLQAFAAGAALCSTSLGTTFTILTTSGLTESRLGVVLTSAAMMDDVVGFVMVKVISALGSSRDSFSAIMVVRPIFVSIAFAVVIPVLCTKFISPLIGHLLCYGTSPRWLRTRVAYDNSRFVLQTLLLVGMATSATYAGTSGLFAAYLAGASVAWYDERLRFASSPSQGEPRAGTSESLGNVNEGDEPVLDTLDPTKRDTSSPHVATTTPHEQEGQGFGSSGVEIYQTFYKPSVDAIFKPFFFASIGFSVPITKMFSGSIVWRGFVYAALMAFGKLVCGIWLVRMPSVRSAIKHLAASSLPKPIIQYLRARQKRGSKAQPRGPDLAESKVEPTITSSLRPNTQSATSPQTRETNPTEANEIANDQRPSLSSEPLSLYPAAILGGAMIARGEIGFLISSIAQSRGIFNDELFLAVTWAIFICTFAGPLLVGSLVRRVRALQKAERSRRTGKNDPMGVWGVSRDVS